MAPPSAQDEALSRYSASGPQGAAPWAACSPAVTAPGLPGQGAILPPGQPETHQAGIKIAGRNINNLRYADDTSLVAESEELKSLLMKVKEESEKLNLKLNIQKTKIMASGPITSWEIDGETVETVGDFIFLGSKITADGDCSHEIKRRLLLPRNKCLLISLLQSPSAVILEPRKIKSPTVSTVPHLFAMK